MVQLDTFTISLLYLRPDGPQLDEATLAELQDAHMAHNADMHDAGHLLIAGPVLGPELRGLSIYRATPDEARAYGEANPSVRAGRHRVEVFPWLVPARGLTFNRTRFPRSVAEVEET